MSTPNHFEYPDLPGFLNRTSTSAVAPASKTKIAVTVEPEPKTKPESDPKLPARSTATTSTDDLTILAGKIKAAHASVGTALQQALDAGRMLIQAKKLVAHGEWLPWIEDHCGISVRTAQAYMRLANEDGQLIAPDEDKLVGHRHHFQKRNADSHLSIRAAVKKVAKPKPADVDVVTEVELAGDDPVVEDFCQQWARSGLRRLFEGATDDQRAAIVRFIQR